jgi:hypothetical protein
VSIDLLPIGFLHALFHLNQNHISDTVFVLLACQDVESVRVWILPPLDKNFGEESPELRASRAIKTRHQLSLILLKLWYEPLLLDPPLLVVILRALHDLVSD